jgi:hypothetical protein
VSFILFGIGAFTYAKHPEGIIEAQTNSSVTALLRWTERRKAKVDASSSVDAPQVSA